MWIRRHWPKFVAFALFVWTVGVRVIGWAGSIDLVVSRTQDPAWMGAVIGYLLSPPIWLDVALIGTGLGLIWWDNKRRIATATVQPEVRSELPKTIKQPKQLTADFPAAVATDDRGPTIADDKLPGWQTLFGERDDGTIQLNIYPDTPHVMRDAFCLLLFAYGLLKDMEEVPKGLIEPEMRRLMSNVPSSPMHKALNIDYSLKAWFVNDFGQSAYEAGRIERVGLSTGIRYKLLWPARDDCFDQARDLIRRA